jgi:hypothetical protein
MANNNLLLKEDAQEVILLWTFNLLLLVRRLSFSFSCILSISPSLRWLGAVSVCRSVPVLHLPLPVSADLLHFFIVSSLPPMRLEIERASAQSPGGRCLYGASYQRAAAHAAALLI